LRFCCPSQKKVCKYIKNAFVRKRNREVIHGCTATVLKSIHGLVSVSPYKENLYMVCKSFSVCDSKRWQVKVILWLTFVNVFRVSISELERTTLPDADQSGS
jgi:hypothetical protein